MNPVLLIEDFPAYMPAQYCGAGVASTPVFRVCKIVLTYSGRLKLSMCWVLYNVSVTFITGQHYCYSWILCQEKWKWALSITKVAKKKKQFI